MKTTSLFAEPRPTRSPAAHILAVAIVCLFIAGRTTSTVKSQAFARLDDLKTELKRGVSTKADVILLLGEPDGTGALGGFDGFRDAAHKGKGAVGAWYYESVTGRQVATGPECSAGLFPG